MYDNFQIHSNTSPSVNSSLHDYTSHLHRENESPLCKWHFKKTSKKERANIISESGWEHVLKRRLPAASRRTYWRNRFRTSDIKLSLRPNVLMPMHDMRTRWPRGINWGGITLSVEELRCYVVEEQAKYAPVDFLDKDIKLLLLLLSYQCSWWGRQ